MEAEKVSYFDKDLQGYGAFMPELREEYAAKFAVRFPRTLVDWSHEKMGRVKSRNVCAYDTLRQKLSRERSAEELPRPKAQKTLYR